MDFVVSRSGRHLSATREMTDYQDTVRRLSLNDERFAESVLQIGLDIVEAAHLDRKTHALVRLGAALTIDSAPRSYQSNVDLAIAPIVGLARVVSAAPELALALGFDVDAALEARGAEAE